MVSIEPFASAQSTPINVSLNDADIVSPLQLQVSFPDDGESVTSRTYHSDVYSKYCLCGCAFTDASQSDDMELAALSKENLALSLLKDTVGSEQTLSFDNSDIIDTLNKEVCNWASKAFFTQQ